MSPRLFAVVLLLLWPSALPTASAAPEGPTEVLPGMDVLVYADLELTQPNLTFLTLSGDLRIHRFVVDGKVYDADDLGDAYRGSNKHPGEASGDAFAAEFEAAARDAVRATLTETFPEGIVTAVTAKVDVRGLQRASGDPLDPPAVLRVEGAVLRTRESAGLLALPDAALDTLFAAGAAARSDFSFAAKPGHQVSYVIGAPERPAGLAFRPGAEVSADGRTIRVTVDARNGTPSDHDVTAYVVDRDAAPPVAEDIRSNIAVALGDFDDAAGGIPVQIDVASEIRALDVGKRFPGALPARLSLPYVNAEALRALVEAGLVREADVSSMSAALLESVRIDAARAFGASVNVTGGLSAQDLALPVSAPFTTDPPLRFAATATTLRPIAGASADDLDLALRVGGAAEVGLQLFAANGRETIFTVRAPSAGEFREAEGGEVSSDGLVATFRVPEGRQAYPASLLIGGRGAPRFTHTDANIDVMVDLEDIDVSVGDAASGGFGDLLIRIDMRAELRVIELPAELRGPIPASLELEHLSADALRLLVLDGRITEADLAHLDAAIVSVVSRGLGAAFGVEVPAEGGLDRASLEPTLMTEPISSFNPLIFEATARAVKPAGGTAVPGSAAIAVYSTALTLALPTLHPLDTEYTVVLPRGISLTSIEAPPGTTRAGTSPDGRDQFVVHPLGVHGDVVTVQVVVTPAFVLVKFWPIFLGALVALTLVIGVPIALSARRRGLAGKKAQK